MINNHDKHRHENDATPKNSGSSVTPSESGDGKETAFSEEHPAEPTEIPTAKIERLETENKSLQDRLLRALAETENVRKRAERDVADARQYAVTQFARDITSVADNLERAMSSLPEDASRFFTGPIKTLVDGVELTQKELLRTLQKHGVTKLHPQGEAFDPNFHEAMFETEDPSVPHGTVTMVAEPGYAIGTRPLRAAKVAVSRGGPARGGGN